MDLIAFRPSYPLEFLADQRKAIKKLTLSVLCVSAVNYYDKIIRW